MLFFFFFSKVQPNGLFTDETGRTLIFHGLNVVYKKSPWIPARAPFSPLDSISSEDIANLVDWGFNMIRLGVMWPGVEPTKGSYNQSYLDDIETLVNDLGAAGIYTMVDFHQDLLHPKLCGEGIPDHALDVRTASNLSINVFRSL